MDHARFASGQMHLGKFRDSSFHFEWSGLRMRIRAGPEPNCTSSAAVSWMASSSSSTLTAAVTGAKRRRRDLRLFP